MVLHYVTSPLLGIYAVVQVDWLSILSPFRYTFVSSISTFLVLPLFLSHYNLNFPLSIISNNANEAHCSGYDVIKNRRYLAVADTNAASGTHVVEFEISNGFPSWSVGKYKT